MPAVIENTVEIARTTDAVFDARRALEERRDAPGAVLVQVAG